MPNLLDNLRSNKHNLKDMLEVNSHNTMQSDFFLSQQDVYTHRHLCEHAEAMLP